MNFRTFLSLGVALLFAGMVAAQPLPTAPAPVYTPAIPPFPKGADEATLPLPTVRVRLNDPYAGGSAQPDDRSPPPAERRPMRQGILQPSQGDDGSNTSGGLGWFGKLRQGILPGTQGSGTAVAPDAASVPAFGPAVEKGPAVERPGIANDWQGPLPLLEKGAAPARPELLPNSQGDGASTPPSGWGGLRDAILPSWLTWNGDFQARQNPLVWATLDYQLFWMQGVTLPPLVTTSFPGTIRGDAGVLGAPGTSVLYGGQLNPSVRSGMRFNTGYWFNPQQTLGIEGGFMIAESQAGIFSASSNDGTILARPFFSTTAEAQQSVLIAFPGSSNGTIDIRARSGNFYEGHLDLTENAYDNDWFRLYSMIGYRFYRYDEGVQINQSISPSNALFIPGTRINTNDRFLTQNQFHGIDFGFRSEFFWDRISLDVLTKLAVGRLFRTYNINGDQTVTVPGESPITQPNGLYALSSNSGIRSNSDWKAMPEFGLTLNYRIRPNCNLRIGYTFILLQSIAHASDQIDTNINTNLLPGGNVALGGANVPAFHSATSSQWIQTLNFGVEFRY